MEEMHAVTAVDMFINILSCEMYDAETKLYI